MSIGWATLDRFMRFRERAREFGLDVAKSKHHYRDQEVFALIPYQDKLPIFSRDAEIFIGNLTEAENWLAGMEWARNYHLMIKATNRKKIDRCEQNIRNDNLLTELAKIDKGVNQ
jgi:hypothetical protein